MPHNPGSLIFPNEIRKPGRERRTFEIWAIGRELRGSGLVKLRAFAKLAVEIPILKNLLRVLSVYGFDITKTITSLIGTPCFIKDVIRYNRLSSEKSLPLRFRAIFPILNDRSAEAGAVKGHYFFQDLWAAEKIFKRRPERHVDIGSRIDGFIAHLLVFMEVDLIDIRAITSNIDRLNFVQDEATELKKFPDDSLDSMSSLNAAEHFGLGRYGDPIDPDGHIKFMKSLSRVLKPGGRLYFSIPIGRERVEFNAHRILSPFTVLEAFKNLELVSFGVIRNDGNILENCDLNEIEKNEFTCGLYEFTKGAYVK